MTNTSKHDLLKQNTYASFPTLIEISHPSFGCERYTDSDEEITFKAHTFTPYVFTAMRPELSSSGVDNGSLSLSCVDQVWIERIRNIPVGSDRVKVRMIVLMKPYGRQTETISDEDYRISQVSWDGKTMSCVLVFDDRWTINIPCTLCNSLVAIGIA